MELQPIGNKCESKSEISKEKGKKNDYDDTKSYLKQRRTLAKSIMSNRLICYTKIFGNARLRVNREGVGLGSSNFEMRGLKL